MAGRALVLSGGGTVGIAWETGIVAGLAEGGIDLRDAGLFLGTSAGSVVGAQLALGRDPLALYEAQLAGPAAQRSGGAAPRPLPDLSALMQVMMKAAAEDRPLEERLAEVGRFALAAQTVDEETFVSGFADRLLGAEAWPEREFRCTAIEATTGRFAIWDRASGAPLARAVASSCAVPGLFPPVTIDGKRYYDGGIRSASNADLAAGAERVLIISLAGGDAPSADPRAALARERVRREVDALRAGGATHVELVTPDDESRQAIGLNAMDSARAPGAAQAGRRQGAAEAARIARAWK